MMIEIIKIEGPTQHSGAHGKSYQSLDVVYKKEGKVFNTKLMDFKFPDVFSAMKSAQYGSCFEVTSEKDAKGYWQWTKASPVSKDSPPNSDSPSTPTSKGGKQWAPKSSDRNWETAVERAWKQTVITRQAALNTAVEILKSNPSRVLDVDVVIPVAAKLEGWITRKDPIQSIVDMQDDVPEQE